jgi:uncharacterized protein YgbK (DUF1537 family)
MMQMESPVTGPALLVIADDLTGANDTGVQFAKRGIRTVVLVEWGKGWPTGYEVVVVNTETRHVEAGVAAERVRRVAEVGVAAGVRYFFKKTDSTLRGNIGAELQALLEVTREWMVPFVPAFPELGRTTRGGIHYVKGVPIAESAFGNDPLSPVRESEVAKVLRCDVDLEVASVRVGDVLGRGCAVYDCESREELKKIADGLARNDALRLLAGSAAFAEELPRVLRLRRGDVEPVEAHGPMLLVNGSMNPRAFEQIEAAGAGFQRVRMSPEVLLDRNVRESFLERLEFGAGGNVLLFSAERREDYAAYEQKAAEGGVSDVPLHLRIAKATGEIVKPVLARGKFGTLVVFGGDTLIGIARACAWTAFVPRTEVEAGITVANPAGSDLTVISKAGGFSDAGVIDRIVGWVEKKR